MCRLTSSIALSFLFIALGDLRLFKSNKAFWMYFALADLPIWIGWAIVIWVDPTPKRQQQGFLFLYVYLILSLENLYFLLLHVTYTQLLLKLQFLQFVAGRLQLFRQRSVIH